MVAQADSKTLAVYLREVPMPECAIWPSHLAISSGHLYPLDTLRESENRCRQDGVYENAHHNPMAAVQEKSPPPQPVPSSGLKYSWKSPVSVRSAVSLRICRARSV